MNVWSAERAVKQIADLEWIYLQKNAFSLKGFFLNKNVFDIGKDGF